MLRTANLFLKREAISVEYWVYEGVYHIDSFSISKIKENHYLIINTPLKKLIIQKFIQANTNVAF